ncbi:MAG TPA: hypothetical protein VFO74_06775 [Pseudolabrys sp.]|nr:hypothetical protein [Pseudolabrys sp.]
MALPPEDVPASELFEKLQQTPRPSEVVAFPRRTRDGKPVGTVRIQVLGMRDHNLARSRAKKACEKAHGFTLADMESGIGAAILSDAVARELLAVACVTEDPIAGSAHTDKPAYARIFPSPESIDDVLSADELAVLFNCYLLVQTKWGPFEKTIQTEDELSSWVKRLVEGAREFPLSQMSSVHWADVASLLARRAFTLSATLESLSPSLPPTLRSRLETYSIGTSYFGQPATSESPSGTETSQNLLVAGVEITIQDAKEMALRMKDAEESANAALDAADKAREF